LGKKGKIGRLKRKPAPRFWPIHRKEAIWIVRPSPGGHSLEKCLPLSLVLRDILEVAETRKEAKKIISQGKVFVDGKVRRKDSWVEGRTIVKDGNSQIALHDGSNIITKAEASESPAEVVYQTFDTLKLGLPDKEVLDQIKTKKGNVAVITGGKNIGKQGRIVDIEKTEAKKRRNALVVVEDEKGNRYQTILDFVFSIGEAQSIISFPEAASVV